MNIPGGAPLVVLDIALACASIVLGVTLLAVIVTVLLRMALRWYLKLGFSAYIGLSAVSHVLSGWAYFSGDLLLAANDPDLVGRVGAVLAFRAIQILIAWTVMALFFRDSYRGSRPR